MPDWVRLYQQIPYPGRIVAASARGAYLRWWRYGGDHESLVAGAIEREHWTLEQWKQWREVRLTHILQRAAMQVPYYKQQWARRRRLGDRASWNYLENWPILNKNDVRENPRAFVSDDHNPSQMFHEHTSGTTGKSLDLWWSRETVRTWYALFEARCRRWYGVSRHNRWAILGGQLVTPVMQRRPPFWVWNAGLNQLYMSSYHLAPDLIPFYLDALIHHRIEYVWGYSSSLYELAQEVLRIGRRDLKMSVAVTNAEPLFDYQRQAISDAFQCPVRETYGLAEIVVAASECECQQLHLWPEVGYLETMNGDQAGELVATGLLNADMPLIRYRTGDHGLLPAESKLCACGRIFPVIRSIEGRTDDMLVTADGRRIGRLDPVFKAHLPVLEAQIIQESLHLVRVLYVPTPEYTPAAGASMINRLRDRLGPVDVQLEAVPSIPRTTNGKFRAVISHLPAHERPHIHTSIPS